MLDSGLKAKLSLLAALVTLHERSCRKLSICLLTHPVPSHINLVNHAGECPPDVRL